MQQVITGANISGSLQQMRRDAGLTVEQLAVSAGVSYSTVSNIERGCRCSDRIAQALLDVIAEARA